ncbi:MAG: hypothetical protein IJ072_02375 [Oscillospiraceae bacterium]|nr:hypothetical protein [Oscillospiraceae bacterium]
MDNGKEKLKKRFTELARRCETRRTWTYSDFLNINEQSVLHSMDRYELPSGYVLRGGYDGAERAIACFGSEEMCGYEPQPPVVCVKAEPLSQKFSDKLTHRDILGAVMSLGIEREVTGDILISENCGYIMCLEKIAGYIASELTSIKHTSVRCTTSEQLPEQAAPELKEAGLVIPSQRLDAVVAAVYKLSRGESQRLFSQGKIFINGKNTTRQSAMPDSGDIVSVSGCGRFIYDGIERETKKGRLRVNVRVYK